jgi:hypothetical protein
MRVRIGMPQIRPITDLRNTNEISEICHKLKLAEAEPRIAQEYSSVGWRRGFQKEAIV